MRRNCVAQIILPINSVSIAGSVDTADAIHRKIFNLDFFQNVEFLTIRLFDIFILYFRFFSIVHSLILLKRIKRYCATAKTPGRRQKQKSRDSEYMF